MATRRQDIDFTGLLMPIITSSRPPPPPQNSRDDVIVRFKPGGYPDDMFVGLQEDERRRYECNICFLVAKDPRQCTNSHLFCATCIFTWTVSSSGDNRDKCPVCRSPGRYRPDIKTESKLNKKRVVCTTDQCKWKGTLLAFRKHYKNVHASPNTEESHLPPIILPTMSHGYVPLDVSTSSGEMQWRVVREPTSTPDAQTIGLLDPQAARGRRRLRHLFETFSSELEQRRRSVDEHYRLREAHRLDQLSEVESLGRRLDDVSADLDRLMSDMTRDSDRYHGYIRTSIDMEDSLLALSQSFPDTTRSGSRRRRHETESCPHPDAASQQGPSSRTDSRRRPIRIRESPNEGATASSTPPSGEYPGRPGTDGRPYHILPAFRTRSSQREAADPRPTHRVDSRPRIATRHIAELPRPLWIRQTGSMLPLRRNINSALGADSQELVCILGQEDDQVQRSNERNDENGHRQ